MGKIIAPSQAKCMSLEVIPQLFREGLRSKNEMDTNGEGVQIHLHVAFLGL